MCDPAAFNLNEPALTVALTLLLPLGLWYPVWLLRQVPGGWTRRLAFLATPPGLPAALIVALFLIAQGLLLSRAYSGYWAVGLTEGARVELDYWWPRGPVRIDLAEVRRILVLTELYRMRGADAERPRVGFETTQGRIYCSQHLLEQDQVASVLEALARCTDAPVQQGIQRGLFGQPEAMDP